MNSSGGQHMKKKYLVAHQGEKKNSIFDYVHLSSNLLRNVRIGQSLDTAILKRNPLNNHQERINVHHHPSTSQLSILPLIQRDGTKTSPKHRAVHHPVDKTQDREKSISFGQVIQLQAIDGGYLCVEPDGSVGKLGKKQGDDPRTFLTLFPHSPLIAPASRSCVRSGDLFFLVQGASTISKSHHVVHANADKISLPPPALFNAVNQYVCEEDTDKECLHETQEEKAWRVTTGDRPTSSTSTFWSMHCFTPNLSKSHKTVPFLQSGMRIQLHHHHQCVHYECERVLRQHFVPGTEPDESSNDSRRDSVDNIKTTQIWLQNNTMSSQQVPSSDIFRKQWDNVWIIYDVHIEKERQHTLMLQQSIESENDIDPLPEMQGEQYHHASRIIVRFIRRVARKEGQRRANIVLENQAKQILRLQNNEQIELNTEQRLSMLQCFKPEIYGSRRIREPLPRRIPGISMQGTRYPAQEKRRLEMMNNSLRFLNSNEFRVNQFHCGEELELQKSPHSIVNKHSQRRKLAEERERERKFHVELIKIRCEPPSLQFGIHTSRQSASTCRQEKYQQ